jgi:hypothetical protein
LDPNILRDRSDIRIYIVCNNKIEYQSIYPKDAIIDPFQENLQNPTESMEKLSSGKTNLK